MLRPSPNHGTQRLPNDDDDDSRSAIRPATVPGSLLLQIFFFTNLIFGGPIRDAVVPYYCNILPLYGL